MPPVLSAGELTVRFGGITALQRVSLQAPAGEVVGVIGPNGAGKTTLFNVICGFVAVSEGTLQWRGESLIGVRPDRLNQLGIARTLQGVGLFERLTVLENVMVGANRFRRTSLLGALLGTLRSDRDERELRERAMSSLARLGCANVAERLPGALPYAIQKQVAIARALVAEPELLLLDEPAGGLGAEEIEALRGLIDTLRGSMTVMLVEHHMDLVMSVCDRVVVLDFGEVVAAGTPQEVQRDPTVLDAYLGRDASEQPVGAAGAGDAEH